MSGPLTWQQAVEQLDRETSLSAEAAFRRGESAGARAFLWAPVRDFGAEWRRSGDFTRGVLTGYRALTHAAKIWEAEMRWRDASVVRIESAGRLSLVRREWRELLDRVLAGEATGEAVGEGRGRVLRVATGAGPVILRHNRRGGAVRWLGDRYFGRPFRPLREFWVLLRARRRGLPVPEPLAAVVERGLCGSYRGALVTAEIPGALSLWRFLEGGGSADSARLVGRRLRELHDAGLWHPDLNLRNILTVPLSHALEVVFVDLDRARLDAQPLPLRARRAALDRVRRSAARLDPDGRVVGEAYLASLERAYWDAVACAAPVAP